MSEPNPKILANQNPRMTWEGCSVLLDINDGDHVSFQRLSPAAKVKIGNKSYSLQPLIGCPFGSIFQVNNGPEGQYLSRYIPIAEGNDLQEKGDGQLQDESKDNRALVDNNMAQSLTGDDIDKMQRQGVSGDEIVDALIANSATFDKKTSFSQEKYRLKKQKKYAPKVLLRRPFARSICEAYFKKHPARIGFLRVDTLSLLLSMANVTTHSDVLVVDMVGGILTGAVAERLGGTGYVCNTHLGATAYPIEIVRIFNLSSESCKRIVRCSLNDLCSAENGTCEEIGKHEENPGSQTHEQSSSALPYPIKLEEASFPTINAMLDTVPSSALPYPNKLEEASFPSENVMLDTVSDTTMSRVIKNSKSAKAGEKASQEAVSSWKENGFSSLIIAAPELDTWNIVQKLLPLISYSAPFAIYHQYLQPLTTCMHNLQLGRMAIGLQISEPWMREYQVLPSRTHPCMQMSASGGYILGGTRICSSEPQVQKL